MIYLQCAESALKSVIGDLSHTYFVGNAPMGHMVTQLNENHKETPSLKVCEFLMVCSLLLPWDIQYGTLFSISILCFLISHSLCQRFFFKSQVIAANKFDIHKCDDFAWVTKDELLEYFPEQAEFLNKMIIN